MNSIRIETFKGKLDQCAYAHSCGISSAYADYMAQAQPATYAQHPEWHARATRQTDWLRHRPGTPEAIAQASARLDARREAAAEDGRGLFERFAAGVRSQLSYKPEDMTADAELLKSPVTLSASDLVAIIDRSADPATMAPNETMRRMATRYAKEHGIELPEGYAADDPDELIAEAGKLLDAYLSAMASCVAPVEVEGQGDMLRQVFGV